MIAVRLDRRGDPPRRMPPRRMPPVRARRHAAVLGAALIAGLVFSAVSPTHADAARLDAGCEAMPIDAALNGVANGNDRVSARGLALRDAGLIDDAEPSSAPEDSDTIEDRLRLLGTLGRAGVSILLQEDPDSGVLERRSPSEGVRTFSVSSEHLARMTRIYRGREPGGASAPPHAVARSTIEWDETTGEYDLKRFEVGLFRGRLWFSRDLGDAEDRPRAAVFLRFEW